MRINTGGVVLGTNFYSGRRSSIRELHEALKDGDVLLLGPRRTGKTSVVQEYLREENEKTPQERTCLYIDLENIKELYEFYVRVLHAITEAAGRSNIFNKGFDIFKSASTALSGIFPEGVKVGELLTGGFGAATIKFPAFEPEKVEALNQSLREILEKTESPIVIVLDEFPELIWKLGRGATLEEQQKIRKEQTTYLLSALRAIRQDGKANKTGNRVIIAGSVNLDNTLEHVGLLPSIADIRRLSIPYLTADQAVEMVDQLSATEKFEFESPDEFRRFIAKQFGRCSPYHLQLFAERLRNQKLNGQIKGKIQRVDTEDAYKDVLVGGRGPKALLARLEVYYTKEEKLIVLAMLTCIAKSQFELGIGPTETECWKFVKEKTKNSEIERGLQSEILGKIRSDDLIEFAAGSENRLVFGSPLLINFWHYTLVGTEFLAR